MSERFLISDLHFGHERLMQRLAAWRPFASIEEHDQAIVDAWNAVVGKRDKVFLLGDVAMDWRIAFRMLPRLEGLKCLVLGNHDHPKAPWREVVDEVAGLREMSGGIVLTHAPIHPAEFGGRYRANIHGHLHEKVVMDGDRPDPRYLNVSVEQLAFRPLPWDEAIARLSLNVGGVEH